MKEPEFWEDVISHVPVCVDFVSRWEEVYTELKEYLEGEGNYTLFNYPKIHVPDINNESAQTNLYEGESWKITSVGVLPDENMTAWGGKFMEDYVKNKFGLTIKDAMDVIKPSLPVIHSICSPLEAEKKLFNSFVSILSPGTYIAPHRGDPGLMRIHLGLVCDPGCHIQVGDARRVWEPGKLIAFKDGGPYPHSVRHDGTKDRWILSFDLSLDYLRTVVDHPAL